MKEFTEYEKKIIRELINVHETSGSLVVLGNIIDFELSPNIYIELKSENNCPIRISKSFVNKIAKENGRVGINETIKQLNNKLIQIVKLFQYLERKALVRLSGELPITILGTTFDVNETPVGYELEDKEMIRLLFHLSRKKIVASYALIKLVNGNFKIGTTKVHDRRGTIIGIGILIVATLAFLNDIFEPFSSHKAEKTIPIKLEEKDTIKTAKPLQFPDSSIKVNPNGTAQEAQKIQNKPKTNTKKEQIDEELKEIQDEILPKFK